MIVKFNGIILNNYVEITDVVGLGIPATTDNEIELSSINGSIFEGYNFNSRIITFSCKLFNSPNKSVNRKLRELKNIIIEDKEKKLEFNIDGYDDCYILGRYSGNMDWSQHGMVQTFPISFKCSNPFFISNEVFTKTINGTDTILNGGQITNDFTISFTLAPNQIMTIDNQTTGKQLKIEADASTRNFIVDMKTGNITDSTGNSNYNKYYKSGDFFTLAKGVNTIKTSGNCVFKYHELYL